MCSSFGNPCPAVSVLIIFFVPGALGSGVVQSVSGSQLGAGHQTLADGQSIVAVTKDALTYLLFMSCCLCAIPSRE